MLRRLGPIALHLTLLATACSAGPAPTVTQAPVVRGVARADPPSLDLPVPAPENAAGPVIAKHAALAPTLDADVFRDDRRMRPRAMALLVAEIQGLESLLQATPTSSPDRPLLLHRLAENYVELEKAAGSVAAAQSSAGARTPRSPQATTVDRARQGAIRYYTTLLGEYAGHPSPTFPSAAPAAYAKLDEVAYHLAYEHERAGDNASARRVYLELLQLWPASPFVPKAYLAFGDMFFAEALSDPSKWDVAGAAYAKVLTAPPPANGAYGYAWYELAYVVANQGDRARALEDFRRAADWATSFPEQPGAALLKAEAEVQMKAFAGP